VFRRGLIVSFGGPLRIAVTVVFRSIVGRRPDTAFLSIAALFPTARWRKDRLQTRFARRLTGTVAPFLAGTLIAGPVWAQAQQQSPPPAPAEPAAPPPAAEGGGNSAQDLAKKLANPVADLVSVPFQENVDLQIGTGKGYKSTLNIQPVIPVTLNRSTNLITRTIVPIVSQANVFGPNSGVQTGLGDSTLSQFWSPKLPTKNGVIWGAGPVEYVPTATKSTLGAGQWGLGPTVVVLRQVGGTTSGFLINQIWGVGGSSDRPYVNSLFFQPFFAVANKTGFTKTVNVEGTYNWTAKQLTLPLNLLVSQIIKDGASLSSLQAGVRVYVARPSSAPIWGLRLNYTLLFPK